jgi:hypothetical protein
MQYATAVGNNEQPIPHFRLHDNGWISLVTERPTREFAALVTRDGERSAIRLAADLTSAQRLADDAVPLDHICSSVCTEWFKVTEPSRSVELQLTCPKHHRSRFSYRLGDLLFRLNTLSFWCLQCGRLWEGTDEQRERLLDLFVQSISRSEDLK